MPKFNLSDKIEKLKLQLEGGNNLVDYFLVCGVHPNICKEKYLYDITNEKYLDNLKSRLKPTILSKFPDFDLSTDTIDEEIIHYCFPKGFIPKNSYNKISPKSFSIILDNNLFSSDHPQKYLTCLLFYERVSQYKMLQLNIENRKPTPEDFLDDSRESLNSTIDSSEMSGRQTVESAIYGNNNNNNINMDLRTSISRGGKLKYYYIPKCICLVSIHPYIKLYEKILDNIYHYSFTKQNIPIEKIITNLIIEVPIPPRGLYSIQYTLTDDFLTLTNFENNKLPIAEINLRKFNKKLSFETIIEGLKHILLCSKILIFGSDLNLICDTILAFLYLIFPFKYPFQVTSFLHKDNYNILESISPFMIGINETYYENFFSDNEINIDGMNIFVIDLDKKSSESLLYESFPEFPKKLLDSLEKEIRTLEVKFKTKKFGDMGGRNSITSYNSVEQNGRVSNTSDGGYSSLKDFNENYQTYFFYFFCQILSNYEKYLNMDYFNSNDTDKVTSIDTLFNCKKFIDSHHGSEIPFYSKFVEDSQLFADFIYKRMIPRNSQEIVDVLLVNETISKIKSRILFLGGHRTDFLDSKGYKIVGKYLVPKPREVKEGEQNYLLSKKYEFKKRGQIITIEKILTSKGEKVKEKEFDLSKINNYKRPSMPLNDKISFANALREGIDLQSNSKNNNKNLNKYNKRNNSKNKEDANNKEEIFFQYFVFPELYFNLYCNDGNVEDYYLPPDYSEEIEAVNTILISKSSLGQNINQNLEMRNYIYLTWLEVWCFTFWYIEKNERQYRFNQMLDILDKIIHHEMNLFNLMFDILNQQNEHHLIFRLYQKLLQLKINPSTFIYNIISNILDKETITELIVETKTSTNKSLKFDINNNVSSLNERTLLSKKDKLLISSKIKFDSVFQCLSCNEKINLYEVCQNYEKVSNDILWVPCKCGEYNLPKINVKFGFELFPSLQTKNKKQNLSTCSTNEIVLHSPYNLKININNAVTMPHGNKLDIYSFKNRFSALFWDFIWYCHIHSLDYTIILPYLKNIEQLNEIAYNDPNNDTLQVTFNNKLYKRNENILYDIRANKNVGKKKTNFVKSFKILVIKKEISVEIGNLGKDRHKKQINLFMDHLKKNVIFKNQTNIGNQKPPAKGISNLLKRVPTKIKNIDFESNLPEISLDKSKRENDYNDLNLSKDTNKINDKKRIGITSYKKKK